MPFNSGVTFEPNDQHVSNERMHMMSLFIHTIARPFKLDYYERMPMLCNGYRGLLSSATESISTWTL